MDDTEGAGVPHNSEAALHTDSAGLEGRPHPNGDRSESEDAAESAPVGQRYPTDRGHASTGHRRIHNHHRKHFHDVRIYLMKDEKVPFSALASVRAAFEWSKIPKFGYKKQDTPELERLDTALRKRYEEQNGAIIAEYYCENTMGAVILAEGDSPFGQLSCVLNYPNERLQLMVYRVEELAHEAEEVLGVHRARRTSRRQMSRSGPDLEQRPDRSEAHGRARAADKQLNWVLRACFSALTAVLASADDLADPSKAESERIRRLEATSREIQELTRQVRAVVQRHARFIYFLGVGAGAVVTTLLVLAVAALAPHALDRGLDVASMAAAAVGGAIGALVSVFQRLSTGDLLLDFTAPLSQRLILGGLRPVAGAVFGVFAQLALSAGLFQPAEAYSARTVGAYAVIGFLAGFSERFAIDIIERAGRTIFGTGQDSAADEASAHNVQDIDQFIASPVRQDEAASFVPATVSASPEAVRSYESIVVEGRGWIPGGKAEISIPNATVSPSTLLINDDGSFEMGMEMRVPPGDWPVTLSEGSGNITVRRSVSLQVRPNRLRPPPSTATVQITPR